METTIPQDQSAPFKPKVLLSLEVVSNYLSKGAILNIYPDGQISFYADTMDSVLGYQIYLINFTNPKKGLDPLLNFAMVLKPITIKKNFQMMTLNLHLGQLVGKLKKD